MRQFVRSDGASRRLEESPQLALSPPVESDGRPGRPCPATGESENPRSNRFFTMWCRLYTLLKNLRPMSRRTSRAKSGLADDHKDEQTDHAIGQVTPAEFDLDTGRFCFHRIFNRAEDKIRFAHTWMITNVK